MVRIALQATYNLLPENPLPRKTYFHDKSDPRPSHLTRHIVDRPQYFFTTLVCQNWPVRETGPRLHSHLCLYFPPVLPPVTSPRTTRAPPSIRHIGHKPATAMRCASTTSPAAQTTAGLLHLLLLATPATAMLRCDNILVDRQKFNFKDLGGPHSVVTTQQLEEWQPFQYRNTTYTLDLCAPLKKDGPPQESCPNGARGEFPPPESASPKPLLARGLVVLT